jgi:hypothetical protein
MRETYMKKRNKPKAISKYILPPFAIEAIYLGNNKITTK